MTIDALQRHHKGLKSEGWAAFYLALKGYRIRARRYKTRYGEIDVIATKGKTIAFVEVKARGDERTGLEAVSLQAQQRIANAAQDYMRRHPQFGGFSWRFDAVVVRPRALPYHLKDAWRL